MLIIFILILTGVCAALSIASILLHYRLQQRSESQAAILGEKINHQNKYQQQLQQFLQDQRQDFDQHQIKSLKLQQESLQPAMQDVRQQITTTLNAHTKQLGEKVDRLTQETSQRLQNISQEVDKQLAKGFEKTTATFTDIVKRLTIIDQAQKRITELSSNVVDLQNLLSDKRSRGAFGEVQLQNIISNMIPNQHYALQHTLSTGKRADCILFLPEPSGNIVIDAKFPLESFKIINNPNSDSAMKHQAEMQFKQDIKKHINDIADKYIIPQETADGAIMFIPAEAIFADIHAYHPDLVTLAQQRKVWMVSPTTMMAVITTASAVLKDEATRRQVHIIREHLIALSKDFNRFQKRMDNLAKHIDQAQQDVSLVHKTSQKISSRFTKIEKVELSSVAMDSPEALSLQETD